MFGKRPISPRSVCQQSFSGAWRSFTRRHVSHPIKRTGAPTPSSSKRTRGKSLEPTKHMWESSCPALCTDTEAPPRGAGREEKPVRNPVGKEPSLRPPPEGRAPALPEGDGAEGEERVSPATAREPPGGHHSRHRHTSSPLRVAPLLLRASRGPSLTPERPGRPQR